MKKQLSITVALNLITCCVLGQVLKANTTVKTNKITFKVEAVKQHLATSNGISVTNIKNIYSGRIPRVSAESVSLYDKIEKGSIIKSFTQVFDDTRLKELTAERAINIFLFVTPTGKVSEVSFLVNKDTQLTAVELEQLENAIKTNVSFNIRPEETQGANFFILPLVLRYQYMLERRER